MKKGEGWVNVERWREDQERVSYKSFPPHHPSTSFPPHPPCPSPNPYLSLHLPSHLTPLSLTSPLYHLPLHHPSSLPPPLPPHSPVDPPATPLTPPTSPLDPTIPPPPCPSPHPYLSLTFMAAVPAYCLLMTSPLLAHISWYETSVDPPSFSSKGIIPSFWSCKVITQDIFHGIYPIKAN